MFSYCTLRRRYALALSSVVVARCRSKASCCSASSKFPHKILALSSLEMQSEGQNVVRGPQLLGHEAQARLQVTQRRFVGGRGFGFSPGAHVEPGEGEAFRFVRDQAAPEIQMMNDVEDPRLEL